MSTSTLVGRDAERAALTAALERAGVESFCRSYEELLACIRSKRVAIVSELYDDRLADRWCDEGGAVPTSPVAGVTESGHERARRPAARR